MFDIFFVFFLTLVVRIWSTLVGGGGSITIPALLFLGLPADQAIATNRLSALSNIVSILKFHKQKQVVWGLGLFLAVFAGSGAAFGSYLVVSVDSDILEKGIGVILLLSLPMLVLSRNMGVKEKAIKLTKIKNAGGAILMLALGILGGFFSSTGIWFSYVYLIYYGLTFIQTAATRKLAGLAMVSTSLAIFIPAGIIDWTLGLSMMVGGGIGGWVSAHYAQKLGNIWIKYLFSIMVFASAVKILIF
ncbi:MAG: hypothetical protein A3B96_03360 [Candidatus Spechtbacteria bacterium RIFCSPHIGHO2_02_FULL_43_15b]|uniref:Probable membrane transporter protein n=1 Tax=Candidatus Spechtbacteria bacterium RIFCSPHIGHO2_01_FULL_43_30 TaxID=1802158 RepID=A0A1G2H4M9_9BACT|nr:MAG: hypothetical protein A2827_00945 [Candidatus Spechtbacteria bacterium RIFCSPHIGHO2_01_FULL_43_30]OGZ58877.1 MAG: hypothetical protein A3B96_03360 [Candidatus Spechtbacteria bacterium RIFCSPHIGHO2_02_FULL_43_15b]